MRSREEKSSKADTDLQNQIRTVRTRLKMSQQELADAAGVARQTIGGIEASLYSPSASVAIKLARVLGCTVEELFWISTQPEHIIASKARTVRGVPGERVAMAWINNRWVAHSLSGELAFRSEMAPADGVITAPVNHSIGVTETYVSLVEDEAELHRTVVVAGCSPGLSLWARSAERWFPGLRVHMISANSTNSLQMLASGEVHAAGIHLQDFETGEFNAPFVRLALGGRSATLINLGTWEEGIVTAANNPKHIKGIADLLRPDVKFVNRELGSGARQLLDNRLSNLGLVGAETAVTNENEVVTTHQAVALSISVGNADAGITVEAIAKTFGLEFIPICSVRYDVAILTSYIDEEPVQQLISTLQHRFVRQQLGLLAGYDTSSTGEVISI